MTETFTSPIPLTSEYACRLATKDLLKELRAKHADLEVLKEQVTMSRIKPENWVCGRDPHSDFSYNWCIEVNYVL